jgi:hypothetical protein
VLLVVRMAKRRRLQRWLQRQVVALGCLYLRTCT